MSMQEPIKPISSDQPEHPRRERFESKFFRPFRRRSRVGAIPGQLRPDATAETTFIHRMVYDVESIEEETNVDLDSVGPLRGDEDDGSRQRIQWINVFGLADTEALAKLGQRFHLHSLLLEDIVHTHQTPKYEVIDDVLVVILHRTDQKVPYNFEQVSMVVAGNTLISFQEHAGDSFAAVARRLRQAKGRIRSRGADYLLYCLIDTVIDGFFPLLEAYGRALEHMEDEVADKPTQNDQIRIRMLKRELAAIRRTSWSHRDTVQRLMVDKPPQLSDSTQLFLRDCNDHVVQIAEVTESFREVVSDLRDLYFTKLSQRTNDIMQVLTIISTIFMPMSFIAGVYGMNFDQNRSGWNMPETEWSYGYPFALLLMAATAAAMLVFFARRGWLSRGN